MKKFTTLIPLQRNDGTPVQASELNAIMNRILDTFGGITVEGETEGIWVDPKTGTVYRDKATRISVALDASRLHEAKALVVKIGQQLGQEAMYFETSAADVEILDVPK